MKRNTAVTKPEESNKATQAQILKALNADCECNTFYQRVSRNEVKEFLISGDLIATKNRQTKVTVNVLSSAAEFDEALEEFLGGLFFVFD